MPRFAANLSMMYADRPFLERFAAAAADGFRAVECQFPYAWPAAEVAARLDAAGLEQVLINTPGSSAARGVPDRSPTADEKGLAAVPGCEDDFREAFALALDYATALRCPRIHAMAGLRDVEAGADRQTAVFVANLRWAAERAAAAGVTVLIEPINVRDTPGYFLNRQAEAHAIVAAVDHPSVRVMLDLYHCQIVEGDVATALRRWLPTGRVGHLQIAGVPERHEPDLGELHYPYLFDVVDSLGWTGWIGCEYRPREAGPGGTTAGLGWLRRHAASTSPTEPVRQT